MLTLPNYQITSRIYESRFTVIYRGKEKNERPVIIKTHKVASLMSRLQREYEIGRQLAGKGAPVYVNLEKVNGRYYLIQEDNNAVSLAERLPQHGLSLNTFFTIATQLAAALDRIHQHNIIHKEINPNNIIVHPKTLVTKIIDFGLATQLPHESQTVLNPHRIEGTLAYISPEQTGRMNRTLDYRSDFYSLGVTFYEMLTRQRPFQGEDPLELVHNHITHIPPLVSELKPEVPLLVSHIVARLMAKNAEDRYQSAHGLQADLDRAFEQWQTHGRIDDFSLGQHDYTDKFRLPQKLYGRDDETNILLNAFDRAAHGRPEILLVSGYSGIGKSALINEIQKPITQKRGYFIAGKFDQYTRSIAYSAVMTAFQSLIKQILSEPEARLQQWRQALTVVLGSNGRIICDLIPELELIIGQQPPVQNLAPAETQNRFNQVVRQFLSVFARKAHPLVIFWDDLQWADSASLKLLRTLVTDPESGYFLFLGAYRDNEVDPSHPLMLMVNELHQEEVNIHQLHLKPLNQIHLSQLLQDTLHTSAKQVTPLAKLLKEKTGGNPFFVSQFLQNLYAEKLLIFNHTRRHWQWQIADIQAQAITDNVVDLMIHRIQQLPPETQQMMQWGACVGNQFDLATLAVISEQSLATAVTQLQPAIRTGFFIPSGQWNPLTSLPDAEMLAEAACQFLHDGVQQAAYQMIPSNRLEQIHLRIGRLLLANTPADELDDRLFDIVTQLNNGRALINDDAEKVQLASLNLQAAEKAKQSTAYHAAAQLFEIGLALLPDNAWQAHYDLTYALHKGTAETASLSGDFERAEFVYPIVLFEAQTNMDKVAIHFVQVIQYQLQGRYAEAIDIQRAALALLGWQVPQEPAAQQEMLAAELTAVPRHLGTREIETLVDALKMQDPEKKAMLEILQAMFYAAYLFGNQTLANLTLVKMTTLSLQFGNSDFSPFGYVGYGLVAGTSLGDYETGYRYGRMAIDLCEQFHNLDITCKANFLFAADVHNWSRHIKESDTFYDRAYETGMESGDWVTMGYTIIQSGSDRLTRGKNLDDLYQITQAHLAFLERAKNYDVVDLLDAGVVQPIRHWQGKTKHKHTFDEAAFSEAAYLQKYAELPYYLAWHYYAKIRAAYHFDDRASWPSLIPKLEIVENFVPSHAKVPETFFYVALMHLALCDEAEMAEREHHFTAVAQLQKRFNIWLENCPANIEHKHLLIEAEKARLHDDRLAAMDLYEQAIAAAAEQDYLNNRALANERYAHFWQQQDRPKIAQVYLLEAITLYGRWGAWGKVQHLEETQAALLQNGFYEPASPEKPNPVGTHYTSTTTTDYLDLATIFKATQTISSEINLDDLLAKMMHIIIENAGAEKGVLLLKQEGDLVIQATIDVNDNRARILQSEPLSESNGRELPESLLRFVSRTGETIVLNDAARDGSFTNDPYIMLREPKSILCLPIRHQDTLMGLLYLENNLIPAAFSEQRIEILTILLSQAAISLENARLFAERKAVEKTLKQYTAELERSNLELQNFAYISSHDLQEPLRKIQTFSDRFANSYQDQLDERGLDYLLRMQNAAARMQTLIQDLLAFARVSSQAKPMSTVDLALLVQDVLTTLETKLEETEATINVQHLPLIEADEAQMKQLFQNLISNALKFQQPDVKPEIHITYVTAVQPESKWPTYQISVSDNGIGFDMKHAERIFDVFQRLHTRSDYPGTGVGLSICRKIVERHHGTIAVQSEPNQGTTFTLALPAKQQPIV